MLGDEDHSAEIVQLFGPKTPSNRVAEGLRLVKAFLKINDPVLRDAVIGFVERIANPNAKRPNDRRS